MSRHTGSALAGTIVVAAAAVFFVGPAAPVLPGDKPIPTEIANRSAHLNEASKQWRKRREDWIENMHRTAPDQRWRNIDARFRQQRVGQRLSQRHARQSGRQQTGALPPDTVLLRNGMTGIWSERGSANLAGRTVDTVYAADSDELLVYSDGGNVWSAHRIGLDWHSLDDNLQLVDGALERFTGVSERMVVASAAPTGMFSSDDRGQSWNAAIIDMDNPIRVRNLVVPDAAGNTLIAAVQHWRWIGFWTQATTIYVSTDRGVTVQQFGAPFNDGNVVSLFSPRYDSTDTWLISGADVYLVDVPGAALLPLGTIPVSFDPATAANGTLTGGVDSNGDTFLYAAYDLGSSTRVYRSTDAGASWILAGTAPTYLFRNTSFASSTRDPDRLITGGIDAFYSHNGGAGWTRVNNWYDYYPDPANRLHADIVSLNHYIDQLGNERLYINTDGGTYESLDGGQTVSNLSLDGLGVSQYYSSLTQRTPAYSIYAGSQDQGFQKAETPPANGTVSFRQSISGDYGHLVSGDDGFSLWTVYPTFAMRYPNAATSDFARFWDFAPNGLTGLLWLPPLAADPLDPAAVYLAGGSMSGSGHHLIRLQDSLGFISATEENFDFGSTITAIAISPVDTKRRYVVTDAQQFFSSDDGGQTWQAANSFAAPDNHYFYGATILASKTDPDRVWVAGSGYAGPAVFESTDGGQTFTAFSTGMPDTLVYDLDVSADDQWLFAATEVGAFYYDTGAQAWVDAVQSVGPDQVYWDVDYIAPLQTARFATYGRGLWDLQVQYVRGGEKPPLAKAKP